MAPSLPTFADVADPVAVLTTPGDYSELTTDSVLDALPGVVGWINDAISWAVRQFGYDFDLVHWLAEAIGGDWGDLLTLRDMWQNLGFASSSVATNLTFGRGDLDPHWNGNAATAFEAHVGAWDTAFTQNREACLAISETMEKMATAAKEFLQAAIDAIELVVSVLGSGGVIGAALRALDIADGVIKAYRVYQALSKTIAAVVSFCESVASDAAVSAPDTKVSVPETPYSGPKSPGTM
jgi:hypothetical protein